MLAQVTLQATSTNYRHIIIFAKSNIGIILFSHQPKSSVAVVIMAAFPRPILVRANTYEEGIQTCNIAGSEIIFFLREPIGD